MPVGLKAVGKVAAWAYLGLGAMLLTGVLVAHLPFPQGSR